MDVDRSGGQDYGGLQTLHRITVKCGLTTERGKPDDLVGVCREGWRVRAPHDDAEGRARVWHMPLSSCHKGLVIEDVASDSEVNRQYRNAIKKSSEAVALKTGGPYGPW